jgi:deoxyribonuclease V
MIAALDVHYDEDTSSAVGAAAVLEQWEAGRAVAEYTSACREIAAYVPGEFYKRELPCLLALIEKIVEPLNVIVIDGYVSLGDKPGLGMRLWEALQQRIPVIGVAKTSFRGANATEVFRGKSRLPLYVTATGAPVVEAAAGIAKMTGAFRIPTLLKKVDRLARDQLKERINLQQ